MFKVAIIIVGGLFALIVIFVIWRVTSVGRGMRQRDQRLLTRLDPIAKRLERGEDVSPQEIAGLAARPEVRHMLFALLREAKRADLMPGAHSSSVAQGESALAYWMMHPNELQEAPEAIELVETVIKTADGRKADFHVYRYRMPPGHWAAKDGWLLGVAGPMQPESEPYSSMPGAFSRAGDIQGKITPSELVDWYIHAWRH